MRSSISTKLIGALSLVFAFSVFAANKVPNLYTDQFHLTGQSANTVPYLDSAQKMVSSSVVGPSELNKLHTATDANTANEIVKRDGSGNFSAGTITGNLTGTASFAKPQFNFTSQTTNYSANFGDWIDCTGASFNVTLPDATLAGASGKPIVVQHNGTSLSSVFTVLTTAGQTIVGAPNSTTYTSGQIALYTNQEHMEFWPTSTGGWKLKLHQSNTGWTDLGNLMNYFTFTVSSANATLAAVYSPAITFTLVSAGNATAAATYAPSYVYTLTSASATAAATYVPAWVYTITSGNATLADVYKDSNGASYTVAATIAAQTTLVTTGTATPPASGTLTRFSGTGDATITFSAVAGNPSNLGTYTVSATIAATTPLVTTSTAAPPNSSGRLVKTAGTGDAVIQYSAVAGAASNSTTCTTAATIAAQTSVVKTCTVLPLSAGTLSKTAGTGDATLPYSAIVGESTASGTKAYRTALTIASQLAFVSQSEGPIPTLSSGKLGKISGTGDTVLTYSAVSGASNIIGITTGGTIPTFYGLPTVNNWKWRRVEGEYAEVWYNYYQSVAQGIAGVGSYVWPMPPNMLINTTIAPATQNLGGGAQAGTEQAEQPSLTQFRWPMAGSADQNAAAYMPYAFAVPWSATGFRAFVIHYNLSSVFISEGSTFMPPTVVIGFNMRVKFPIQGWIP